MSNNVSAIINQYRELAPLLPEIKDIVTETIQSQISKYNLYLTNVESRIKTEKSLRGKLELKGWKYKSLSDITDILGVRIITVYNDELDAAAALVEKTFHVDWENSVDKRKLLESDRFGYISIHYICTIPRSMYFDEKHPELNELKFEIQIRTILQHAWATINHDIGYKTNIEIPMEYKRKISRLAGLLEIADDEFSDFRKELSLYRESIQHLMQDGDLNNISFNIDTYTSYISLEPFAQLNESIAASIKAEIAPANLLPYYPVFAAMKVKTIADLEKIKSDYSEDAKRLALYRMGNLELDIMSSTVAVNNLCIVYIIKNGFGQKGIKYLFDIISGVNESNEQKAAKIIKQAEAINII